MQVTKKAQLYAAPYYGKSTLRSSILLSGKSLAWAAKKEIPVSKKKRPKALSFYFVQTFVFISTL